MSKLIDAEKLDFISYQGIPNGYKNSFDSGILYAMNLINTLHYEGLGTIPLSCGFYSTKLKMIQKSFDIPDNEVMVVIIGCGELTEEVKIAASSRKEVCKTNVFH